MTKKLKSMNYSEEIKKIININNKELKMSRETFSEMIVLYELVLMSKDSEGISIEKAVHGENGLANIYNLTSVMANDYFDRLDAAGYIHVDRTAGLDMIYLVNKMEATDVLEYYYKKC